MIDGEHLALSFFVAGYFAADPPEPPAGQTENEAARGVAQQYKARYERGACLKCGREGVVILGGGFCERCDPDVEMVIYGDGDDAYKACADTGPDGFACTLPTGHSGQHVALDGEYTWSDDDE